MLADIKKSGCVSEDVDELIFRDEEYKVSEK